MNTSKSLSHLRYDTLFLLSFMLLGIPGTHAQTAVRPITIFSIDASTPVPPPETGYLQMGDSGAGISPGGHTIGVNSRYILLDGKPWLPVMGEFHYSRYPAKYWEEEILKMKAGGVQIVSTYIFWIHHEEIEGQFDWSGQRNLRKFVELCAKHGMYVYPRIGPWAHGEARNGGLPDWLIAECPTRVNDSTYLSHVRTFYNEIGNQLKGFLWKDGGPIIGIQIENEYTNRGPNGGAAHIITLKKMAIEAGFDVPLYTVTGWDNAVVPPHIVIPVFGGYPDEAWSGSKTELPPDTQHIYQFYPMPGTESAAVSQKIPGAADDVQLWHYPKCTAELGAGMQVTYHRRVEISEDDIPPIALTSLGSGANLLGYYMFHGGSNPGGKRTTLQESQATDYPNDVPVVSYDFQAPLREFGQMNGSFRKLKVLHRFIQDFGTILAPMTAVLPDIVPAGGGDTSTLRLAARTDGKSGFLFFNNYLRHYPLPIQKGVQVKVKFQSESITVPEKPVDIPSQSCFFWPLNLDLNGALLKYATAQPFTKIHDGNAEYYFFITAPNATAEFVFDEASISSFRSTAGDVSRRDNNVYLSHMKPSTNAAVELRSRTGVSVYIVVLSQQQAQDSWKIRMNGKEYLVITTADVFVGNDTLNLRSRNPNAFSISLFPINQEKFSSAHGFKKIGSDGVFVRYTASVRARKIPVSCTPVRTATYASPVRMGKYFEWRKGTVAMPPDDSCFSNAGIWRIKAPKGMMRGLSNVFLKIDYTGDIGRLYDGTQLLDDNFYNGTAWEFGAKFFPPVIFSNGIDLKILPLRKDAPIYLPRSSWPDFKGDAQIARVKSITAAPEYEVKVRLSNGSLQAK